MPEIPKKEEVFLIQASQRLCPHHTTIYLESPVELRAMMLQDLRMAVTVAVNEKLTQAQEENPITRVLKMKVTDTITLEPNMEEPDPYVEVSVTCYVFIPKVLQ